MIFSEILPQLIRIKEQELPGVLSHNKIMNSEVRRFLFEDFNEGKPPKESAVLGLVYPDKTGIAKMVFILRKTYDGHHSGQIAFPGGKREPFDADLLATALREAQEEIGIDVDKVRIIKELTMLHIPVSNYNVQAFLGITHQTPAFVKDPAEVEEILEIPFASIVNNELASLERQYKSKAYKLNAFDFEGLKIWGATAMILSEIVDLYNKQRS